MSNPSGKSRSVAVIVPVFNAEQTITAAVRSALREPEAREVVVVDDGSDDDSAELAAGCDDGSGRLRVIRQANRGPSAAFNRGVEASSADYVCRLDADDLLILGSHFVLAPQEAKPNGEVGRGLGREAPA